MAPSVMTILGHQTELASRARRCTGDANEAALLVGRVMCRALGRFTAPTPAAEISDAMRRHLDQLIEQALERQH